jgi:polyphenol oxidase
MSEINQCTNERLTFNKTGTIPYLQFSILLKHKKFTHAIFTRKGGISKPPYDSLNVSFNTGDHNDCVGENLALIKNQIGAKNLISMNQVHGTGIITLRGDTINDIEMSSADAIITDIPLLGIMVKQADCQGVIMYDPYKSVAAVAHCGWRGNVQDILGSVVKRMEKEFGCKAENITAAIGPSLGPCCAEFRTYKDIFPPEFTGFLAGDSRFNLWEISRMQLLKAGLLKTNIETACICTKCNNDLFYSYRADGDTGRFGAVAMIR